MYTNIKSNQAKQYLNKGMVGSINIHYNCPMEDKYLSVTLRNVGVKRVANTLLVKGPFIILNVLFVDFIIAKEMTRLLEEESKHA